MRRKYWIVLSLLLAVLFVGCSKQADSDRHSESENQVSHDTEINGSVLDGVENQSTETVMVEPSDEDMVLILDYIPDMVIDLKYATIDNFTGQVIYENDDAYLRYGTVKKLMQVQEELKTLGYKLVLWDGYRPVAAQFKLWDICPDSTYVANPNKGFSKHSRGNTVDITIVTLDGQLVEMPTGFDDFTKEADRDYSDVSEAAAKNSQLLEDIMTKAGFKGYSGEWWHYSDTTEYQVVE